MNNTTLSRYTEKVERDNRQINTHSMNQKWWNDISSSYLDFATFF